MSECITHTAVVDDCIRLIKLDPAINEYFKTAVRDHLEMARLGGITRHGDRENPGLLERYRAACENGDYASVAPKLGFVLGWMSHRAADRQFKIVFRQADPDCELSPTDCSVYHDAFLFREVYRSGKDPFLAGTLNRDVSAFEDALHLMWRRMLIRIHTFIPDHDDCDGWLDRVNETRQKAYVDIKRYAEAYAAPEPEFTKRFIEDVNFYDAKDPLLQLLAALRGDAETVDINLDEALAATGDGSLYARATARAFGYVRAANAFFKQEIDRAELERRLEIGRPELSG